MFVNVVDVTMTITPSCVRGKTDRQQNLGLQVVINSGIRIHKFRDMN